MIASRPRTEACKTALVLGREHRRLVDWLSLHPDLEVVARCDSVAALLEKVKGGAIDFAVVDAALDGRRALALLSSARDEFGDLSLVIVSAHREDAYKAFEAGAVDFLEPSSDLRRINRAVERAVDRVAEIAGGEEPSAGGAASKSGSDRVQRVILRAQDRWVVLPVASILRAESEGNYLVVYHEGEEPLRIRHTMSELERRLDPAAFFRVHRSKIVRLDQVTEVLASKHGDLRLRLRDGAECRVPRARRETFLSALEGSMAMNGVA